jgi:Acetyltransferase (GNAT) domain
VIAFHSGTPTKGFKADFDPYLFNSRTHRLTQAKTGWKEFHLLDHKKKLILSSIYFHASDWFATSPARAPFGGFELSQHVSPKDFWEFFLQISHALEIETINHIEIQLPPALLMTNHSMVISTLVSQEYEVIQAEPNCTLMVDDIPLKDKMGKDKKVKLRHGMKAGLTFETLPLSNLHEVYSFIELFRKKLNRKLSMTLVELQSTIAKMPKSFFMVGVYLKGTLVAACICVRVSKSIVYTFYSAHDSAFDKISPRVFLLDGLYNWCSQNKIKFLDLGTSTWEGKPNFNLLDFKMRIGSTMTTKFRLRKNR